MNRIKFLRRQNRLSQADLADFLNVKPNTISRYESGAREPDIDVLLKLADYFHVTTDYLLGKAVSAQPEQSPYTKDTRSGQPESPAGPRQLTNGSKALHELDDGNVSNKESLRTENNPDPDIQRLYNRLDETGRIQVKGYIHRLLDEKDGENPG